MLPEVSARSGLQSVSYSSAAADAIRFWSRMVRGAFLEIPGLRLTRVQVQRLWDLEGGLSDTILDALVRERFLQRTPEGGFVCVPRAVDSHRAA